jgi:hypothetical protein
MSAAAELIRCIATPPPILPLPPPRCAAFRFRFFHADAFTRPIEAHADVDDFSLMPPPSFHAAKELPMPAD